MSFAFLSPKVEGPDPANPFYLRKGERTFESLLHVGHEAGSVCSVSLSPLVINAWKQFQSQLPWRVPAVLAVTHLVVTLTKLGFKASPPLWLQAPR